MYKSMQRMISKSTISNSTRSAEVTFLETMIGQFVYTRVATGSSTGVETEIGCERISGLILKFSAILSCKRKSSLCCLYIERTIYESNP